MSSIAPLPALPPAVKLEELTLLEKLKRLIHFLWRKLCFWRESPFRYDKSLKGRLESWQAPHRLNDHHRITVEPSPLSGRRAASLPIAAAQASCVVEPTEPLPRDLEPITLFAGKMGERIFNLLITHYKKQYVGVIDYCRQLLKKLPNELLPAVDFLFKLEEDAIPLLEEVRKKMSDTAIEQFRASQRGLVKLLLKDPGDILAKLTSSLQSNYKESHQITYITRLVTWLESNLEEPIDSWIFKQSQEHLLLPQEPLSLDAQHPQESLSLDAQRDLDRIYDTAIHFLIKYRMERKKIELQQFLDIDKIDTYLIDNILKPNAVLIGKHCGGRLAAVISKISFRGAVGDIFKNFNEHIDDILDRKRPLHKALTQEGLENRDFNHYSYHWAKELFLLIFPKNGEQSGLSFLLDNVMLPKECQELAIELKEIAKQLLPDDLFFAGLEEMASLRVSLEEFAFELVENKVVEELAEQIRTILDEHSKPEALKSLLANSILPLVNSILLTKLVERHMHSLTLDDPLGKSIWHMIGLKTFSFETDFMPIFQEKCQTQPSVKENLNATGGEMHLAYTELINKLLWDLGKYNGVPEWVKGPLRSGIHQYNSTVAGALDPYISSYSFILKSGIEYLQRVDDQKLKVWLKIEQAQNTSSQNSVLTTELKFKLEIAKVAEIASILFNGLIADVVGKLGAKVINTVVSIDPFKIEGLINKIINEVIMDGAYNQSLILRILDSVKTSFRASTS